MCLLYGILLWAGFGTFSATVAVEEFGHEQEHGALFVETLRVFTASDAMVAMTTSYSCDQEPELAEAYFSFTSTFVRCCPMVEGLHPWRDFFQFTSLGSFQGACLVDLYGEWNCIEVRFSFIVRPSSSMFVGSNLIRLCIHRRLWQLQTLF